MRLSSPASVLLLSLIAALPAAAWEYGSTDLGQGQIIHHAAILDRAQTANIIFGCNNLVPGQVQFQLVSNKAGTNERPVVISIAAGGQTFAVDATLGAVEGMQLVSTGQTGAVGEAARAVYGASGDVTVDIEGDVYIIDGGANGDAFGAMLDACG